MGGGGGGTKKERGGEGEGKGGVFLRGVDTPMDTMSFIHILIAIVWFLRNSESI